MEEYSRRQLATMTTKKLKEIYVTNIRLGVEKREVKEALEERGISVPSGTNPRSLIE